MDRYRSDIMRIGMIWVYSPGDDGVMAFTDFGIETLTGLIEICKADPDLLNLSGPLTQVILVRPTPHASFSPTEAADTPHHELGDPWHGSRRPAVPACAVVHGCDGAWRVGWSRVKSGMVPPKFFAAIRRPLKRALSRCVERQRKRRQDTWRCCARRKRPWLRRMCAWYTRKSHALGRLNGKVSMPLDAPSTTWIEFRRGAPQLLRIALGPHPVPSDGTAACVPERRAGLEKRPDSAVLAPRACLKFVFLSLLALLLRSGRSAVVAVSLRRGRAGHRTSCSKAKARSLIVTVARR